MKLNRLLTTTAAFLLISGCATEAINSFQSFQAEDLNPLVKAGRLVQKTDSFFVINDSSASMSRVYTGASDYRGTKLDVEKDLLNKLNKSIPAIPLTSGLLSFGYGSCLSWQDTQLIQPIIKYSPKSFDDVIGALHCSSGGTPLATAVKESKRDIAAAPGNIGVIVFSDGLDDSLAITAANDLKAQYGDRLCIYTVWVGNHDEARGKDHLQAIADNSGCGFATEAAVISSPQGMRQFVEKVFFKEGMPVANPVKPAEPKCKDTPKGAILDKDGCWAFHGVLFDFDSDRITSKANPAIQNAVEVLKLNPGLTIEIQGHTDGKGTIPYNQKLSERRALAVKHQLIKEGIDPKRLTTIGYGKSLPVASNETAEGRAYNRRVEYKRTDR
jgi:OmpA-OmpF porin, OOP family